MAKSLGELVSTRPNDYRELERRYAEATGGELVSDPFASGAHGPSRLTKSASVLIGAHNSAGSSRSSSPPSTVGVPGCWR